MIHVFHLNFIAPSQPAAAGCGTFLSMSHRADELYLFVDGRPVCCRFICGHDAASTARYFWGCYRVCRTHACCACRRVSSGLFRLTCGNGAAWTVLVVLHSAEYRTTWNRVYSCVKEIFTNCNRWHPSSSVNLSTGVSSNYDPVDGRFANRLGQQHVRAVCRRARWARCPPATQSCTLPFGVLGPSCRNVYPE